MKKCLPVLTALICTLSTTVFASDRPLPQSLPNRISQGYGEWNLWGDLKFHTGWDVGGTTGTQIQSVGTGTVVLVQENGGNCVELGKSGCEDHGFGNSIIIRLDEMRDSRAVYVQ
jgi:murein DD-endopeptidase MepM/ murein hydrolase activator NlpD